MNTAQNPILKKEHLSFSEERLNNLVSFMKKIKLEEDIIKNKFRERVKSKK